MAGTVTRIRVVPSRTVRAAAQAFLDTLGSPNTRRACTIAVAKTADRLDGRSTPAGLGCLTTRPSRCEGSPTVVA